MGDRGLQQTGRGSYSMAFWNLLALIGTGLAVRNLYGEKKARAEAELTVAEEKKLRYEAEAKAAELRRDAAIRQLDA